MTVEHRAAAPRLPGRWDSLIIELHSLRVAAGEPSYAEITRRLVAQRLADGRDEHAARVAKSSVHDAMRLGRSRINVPLVRELVHVLGGHPDLVDEWIARAHQQWEKSLEAPPGQPRPAAGPQGPPDVPQAPGQADERADEQAEVGPSTVVLLMAGCLAINLLGREFVDFFAFPIYLDMVGTAIAAIALGPWRGASVGLATNLVGALGSGWISLPFAAVNVVGALVWGYGVRRWDMGRTLPRFFALNLGVALACSAVAVPILLLAHEGLRAGHDSVTMLVQETLGSVHGAVAFSNLLTSSADKLLSGFVALVVVSTLPVALRGGVAAVAGTPPSRPPVPRR